MKGVVNKDGDLEINTLTDGKPVELIPQHRGNMVELSPVRNQPGCSVEDRLQPSHDNVGIVCARLYPIRVRIDGGVGGVEPPHLNLPNPLF